MSAPSHFSSPPSGSGLAARSLRGEALAYLASGIERMWRAGAAGAVWIGEDGGLERVPGLFSVSVPSTAALDGYRVGLLGFLCSGRAPAAPMIPFSAAPVAFRDLAYVDWPGYGGGTLPAPLDDGDGGMPPPAWGRAYRVARSAEEASGGGGWLVPDESSPPGSGPLRPFAPNEWMGEAEKLCLAWFMASASEPQPVPALEPPVPSPLSAKSVSAAFLRPDSDPAAATRCWIVDSWFALDASPVDASGVTRESFRYVLDTGSDVYAHTSEEVQRARSGFYDRYEGKSFKWSYSTDEVTYGVDAETAFWSEFAAAGGGSLRRRDGYQTVRVTCGGHDWVVLDRTWADDPPRQYWVWLGGDPGSWYPQPDNTEPTTESPYWRATDARPGRAFDVEYFGSRPDSSTGEVPDSPADSGPLACGGVPAASPDDVAVQLVFVATVELWEDVAGDAASAGASRDSGPADDEWRGSSGDIGRVRRWRVSGPVPGYARWTRDAGSASGRFDAPSSDPALSGPDAMADFVESVVLPAAGVDPGGLLRGSASVSPVAPPDADGASIVVCDAETGEEEGSIPYVEEAYSGDLVVRARLDVRVRFDAGCVFESGYCA